MVELDIAQTTTTDLRTAVKDFTVDAETLDSAGIQVGEFWWDYPDAEQNLGYGKQIPELRGALKTLSTYTVGLGIETDDSTKAILELITGMGEDSFQSIMWNMQFMKLLIGDSMAEIILREDGSLLNLKPLFAGDMRTNFSKQGIITGYVHRIGEESVRRALRPEQVLHIINDRIGNEMHGQAVPEICKFVIEAKNEAMRDERMLKHRELAMGILEIDTDNKTKRNAIITQYGNAVKNGEVIVLPKGTAELKPVQISPQQRLEWIRYLDNFFYQAVGVPKAVANPEGLNEANSKIGFLSFEPTYIREQTLLEADLLSQIGITVKFRRPPSIGGFLQQNENKNTGQVNLQQNEIQPQVGRTE